MRRWRSLKRQERKCTECDSGEVEDVKHREREELMCAYRLPCH